MSTINYPKNPKDLHKAAVYSLKQKCSVLAAFHMFRRRQKQKAVSEGGMNTWLGWLSLTWERYQSLL